MAIMLVEDDRDLAHTIIDYLELENIHVTGNHFLLQSSLFEIKKSE